MAPPQAAAAAGRSPRHVRMLIQLPSVHRGIVDLGRSRLDCVNELVPRRIEDFRSSAEVAAVIDPSSLYSSDD
jgi:hypothetical protein